MESRFLFVVFFVCLCQILTFSVPLSEDNFHIDEYDAQNCTHNGVTRKVGEKWGDHCLKYHCVKGQVKILHQGCPFQGHCKKNGAVWTNHCVKRTCVVKHGKQHIKVLEGRCQGKGHHCHKVGTKWHEKHHGKCEVRKCMKVHHNFVAKKMHDC